MAKKNKEHIEDEIVANTQSFEDETFVEEAGLEEEQVGFPPYFSPREGRKLKIRPVNLDQRDPTFPRWVVQATHGVACQTGPSDEALPVMVKAGEYFSMSMYAGLPLQRYLGEEIVIECKEERDISGGKSFWVWSVKASPEVRARVAARLQETRRLIAEQNGGAAPILLLGDDLYQQSQAAKKRVEDAMKAAKALA